MMTRELRLVCNIICLIVKYIDALTYNYIVLLCICSGAVYYYTLTGLYWSRQSKILATDGAAGDFFGSSVSIYNNTAFIGATGDDENGGYSGM